MSSTARRLSGVIVAPMHSMTSSCHVAWYCSSARVVRRCTVAALQPHARTTCKHLMCRLPHVLQVNDGSPDVRHLGNMRAYLDTAWA
jgi:hypothetical protein